MILLAVLFWLLNIFAVVTTLSLSLGPQQTDSTPLWKIDRQSVVDAPELYQEWCYFCDFFLA